MIKLTIEKATIPWQEKPKYSKDVIWRYNANPIVDRYAIFQVLIVFLIVLLCSLTMVMQAFLDVITKQCK